jgi:hypothetical protein
MRSGMTPRHTGLTFAAGVLVMLGILVFAEFGAASHLILRPGFFLPSYARETLSCQSYHSHRSQARPNHLLHAEIPPRLH